MTRDVRGILIDLDDTLIPQSEFLGFLADDLADLVAARGGDRSTFVDAFEHSLARGSDRGGVIDAAVAAIDGDPAWVAPLVERFRAARPVRLTPYPGVLDSLRDLRAAGLRLVIVTDGNPAQQRAKVRAAGLDRLVDGVVCSDDWGRSFRKPNPIAFRAALRIAECDAAAAVMIGDRPDKDIVGAAELGMTTVRVRTGEHVAQRDQADIAVDDFAAAARWVIEWVPTSAAVQASA